MSKLAISRNVSGSLNDVISRLEPALKEAGFGVLTRIDLDQKILEKLGKEIPRTVILGACNPKLAHDAYLETTDVALLLPCNVVVRETGIGTVAVEAIRPTKMLEILPAISHTPDIDEAERRLAEAIQKL